MSEEKKTDEIPQNLFTQILPEEVDIEPPIVEKEAKEPEFDQETLELAKKYGWKSEDEWGGEKPEQGLLNPDEYLQRPGVQVQILKDENKALREAQAQEKQTFERIQALETRAREDMRKTHEREVEEIRREQREAAETANIEAYDAATKKLDELKPPEEESSTPDLTDDQKQAQDWIKTQSWWNEDPLATTMALQLSDFVGGRGGNWAEQQKEIERMLEKSFPEYTNKKPDPKPDPNPNPGGIAPAPFSGVDGGGLAGGGAGKSSQLPPEARAAGVRFVSEGLFNSIEEYADDYFQTKTLDG